MSDIVKQALEAARHELVTLHGLVVTDKPVGGNVFVIDTSEAISKLDKAIQENTNNTIGGHALTTSDREAIAAQSIVKKLPQIQIDIIGEISNSLALLGANSGLMACVTSWGDTLPQEDILQMLKEWNDKAVKENWVKSQAVIV